MVVIPIEFSDAIALTKSDTTDLTGYGLRGLYVGATGDVVVTTTAPGSAAVTFKAVPAGTVLHIPVKFLMAATASTSVVGLVGK